MRDSGYDVVVDKEVWELIPTFIENRKKELSALRAALTGADIAQLRLLGHRIKGVGASYGFPRVSALGKEIEDCVRADQLTSLTHILDVYGDYLSRVRVSCA